MHSTEPEFVGRCIISNITVHINISKIHVSLRKRLFSNSPSTPPPIIPTLRLLLYRAFSNPRLFSPPPRSFGPREYKRKFAKVIPLFKKGCPLTTSNYRPISLLSVFSKIAEKVMYERLYKFLEKHEILYSLQFGFRASHSINHALVSLTEAIKNSLDNRKLVVEYSLICRRHLIQ